MSHLGAMGKRTRYQQTDKAQLLLQVTRSPGEGHTHNGNDLVAKENIVMPKVKSRY